MMHNHNFNPKTRGYRAAYHPNEINHCPGCGRTHWFIGRRSAECAFCATALPFTEQAASVGAAATVFQRRHIEPARRGRFTINGRS